jgi:hypothetical protein
VPAAFLLLLSVGCTTRIGDFTVISTKNCAVAVEKSGQRVEGEDSVHIILGIPTGTPNLKTAVDNAIQKGGGDCMIDAVIEARWWTAILYGQSGIAVTGTVINTKGSGK